MLKENKLSFDKLNKYINNKLILNVKRNKV